METSYQSSKTIFRFIGVSVLRENEQLKKKRMFKHTE